jgi:hypothetical protein
LAEAAGFRVTSPRDPPGAVARLQFNDNAAAITKELIRREFIVDYRPGAGAFRRFLHQRRRAGIGNRRDKKIRDQREFETTGKLSGILNQGRASQKYHETIPDSANLCKRCRRKLRRTATPRDL